MGCGKAERSPGGPGPGALQPGGIRPCRPRADKAGRWRTARLSFPRWLSGESTPSDERFIRALADELGDQEIVSASVDDRCGTNREVLDLLTRFRRLSAAPKRDVRALINESFRDNTATRT